jgi:flagellin
MATASITSGSRIRTNIPSLNAYNTLSAANRNIANRQLRLSTGMRINSAADDVSGYITSRALSSRNSALMTADTAVGEAKNVTAMVQDSLDNINSLMNDIKTATASASSGALGTDEKIALAKGAYRLAEQIQTVVDSTVFGGRQLIDGTFTGDWTVGYKADDSLLEIEVDLLKNNTNYDLAGDAKDDFDLNSVTGEGASNFAGVAGLNLTDLKSADVVASGIFNEDQINTTLASMSTAINNINKVASYVGGIEVRLNSQEELLSSQITNYKAAISRIEDADVATEQMELIKAQFLQQSSLISLAQANQNPQSFLQLFS